MEDENFTPKLRGAEKTRSTAHTFNLFSFLCLLVSGVFVLMGLFQDKGNYWTAGVFAVGSFMLAVIAQLLHIRAELERKRK